MSDLIKEIEAWDEEIIGEELFDEIQKVIAKYLVLPQNACEAISLWIAHTYLYDCKDISPNLVFASPEKRCGKTTAVTLIAQLVNKPLVASNITPAAIFRTIELCRPTLIIDEADTYLNSKNDDMRGIINSSHNKSSAFIIRTEGEKTRMPKRFSTWAPIAIAGIGRVPDTIQDRSIIIPMRRKLPDEKVSKLRANSLELEIISRKIKRWAGDNSDSIESCEPTLPNELSDRAADNWEILFAIAESIGGCWLNLVKQSALKLSGEIDDSESSKGVKLLSDLRIIFQDVPRMASRAICNKLNEMEESHWKDLNYGKGMTQKWLASILSLFGIKSKDIRFDDDILKGYERGQFNDAFTRYLPDISATTQHSKVVPEPDVADVADKNCDIRNQSEIDASNL